MKPAVIAAAVASTILAAGQPDASIVAAERMKVQLSPAISMAPASVVVRAIVERDAKNRALEFVADSGLFYRRSLIELDGAQAPRVNELRLMRIPGGEYEVTVTLYDEQGPAAVEHKTLMVTSTAVDR